MPTLLEPSPVTFLNEFHYIVLYRLDPKFRFKPVGVSDVDTGDNDRGHGLC